MIFLGRDSEGEQVYLDDSRSRAVLICGKRGSGKSYTMGVFLEELAQREMCWSSSLTRCATTIQ